MKTFKFIISSLAFIFIISSCSKEEIIDTTDIHAEIDFKLADQTDWEFANQIQVLINNYRVAQGLQVLEMGRLCSSAYAIEHTLYMINQGRLSHDNFERRSSHLKLHEAKIVSENVAFGYDTAESVVHAWLNSPNHKETIEGPYTHSGYGIVKDNRGYYYITHLFYRQ